MKIRHFAFPRMSISVAAPEEVLETLGYFYPHYIRKQKIPSPSHTYEIEKRGNQWVLVKDGRFLNDASCADHAVFSLEYDIEISLLQRRGHWMAVHAGCVAIGDSACLVAGNPDSGKTTVTFHLVEMGHRFMCEEIAFVDAGTREVHPFLQTMAMEMRYIEDLKRHFPVEAGKILRLNPSLVRYSPEHIQCEPLKASTILVPSREPGFAPEVVSLNPSAFLTEFLSYCFEPIEDMETFVDSVIGVLEKCRIYIMRYRDINDCRKLLLNLFCPASTF